MSSIVVSTNYDVLIEFEADLNTYSDGRCFEVLRLLPFIKGNNKLFNPAIKGCIIHIAVDGERIRTGYEDHNACFYDKKWYGSIIHDTLLEHEYYFHNYNEHNEAAKKALRS